MSRLRLPTLTRRLGELIDGGKGAAALAQELSAVAPELASQIEADGGEAELLARWGQSSRCDASAPATPTVRPEILDAIGLLAGGVDMSGQTVHAGLMHTYGYLLSNLKTPFGFKRERYTKAEIARGLGLRPLGLLSAYPPRGTLLSNLTGVSDAVAGEVEAAGAVAGFVADNFRRFRILEQVRWLDGNEFTESLVLQTDLLELIGCRESKHSHLLVYSILRGEARSLVTAFPVMHWVVGKLRKKCAKKAGDDRAPIKLRYNACLENFGGRELRGQISVEEL